MKKPANQYQTKLISGRNIKTLNGQPLLGGGDLNLPELIAAGTLNPSVLSGPAASAKDAAAGGGIANSLSSIESRLDSLGFEQGTILVGGSARGSIYKQGNYVIAIVNGGHPAGDISLSSPIFRPKNTRNGYIAMRFQGQVGTLYRELWGRGYWSISNTGTGSLSFLPPSSVTVLNTPITESYVLAWPTGGTYPPY